MVDSPLDETAVSENDPESIALVQAQALSERTIDLLNRLFSSLADPTRLRILHALMITDELCVCDLAVIADLSVSAVSHQLRLLRDRDLVRARRDGRVVYYSLADQGLVDVLRLGVEHINRG